jgi:hypothetical protein
MCCRSEEELKEQQQRRLQKMRARLVPMLNLPFWGLFTLCESCVRLLKEERDTFLGEHGRDDDDRRDRDRDRDRGSGNDYGGYGYDIIIKLLALCSHANSVFAVVDRELMAVTKAQETECGTAETAMSSPVTVKEAVTERAAEEAVVTATRNSPSAPETEVADEGRPRTEVVAPADPVVVAEFRMAEVQVGPGMLAEVVVGQTSIPTSSWTTKMMVKMTAEMTNQDPTNISKLPLATMIDYDIISPLVCRNNCVSKSVFLGKKLPSSHYFLSFFPFVGNSLSQLICVA